MMRKFARVFMLLLAVISASSFMPGGKKLFDGKSLKGWVCEPFVDYEGITINEKGPIGLQLHAGVHMAVQFRNLKIKEL